MLSHVLFSVRYAICVLVSGMYIVYNIMLFFYIFIVTFRIVRFISSKSAFPLYSYSTLRCLTVTTESNRLGSLATSPFTVPSCISGHIPLNSSVFTYTHRSSAAVKGSQWLFATMLAACCGLSQMERWRRPSGRCGRSEAVSHSKTFGCQGGWVGMKGCMDVERRGRTMWLPMMRSIECRFVHPARQDRS